MRWVVSVLVVGLLGSTGCGPSGGGTASGEEVAWGVGSKADDGSCDPRDDLCWSSQDSLRMKRILGQAYALLLELSGVLDVDFEVLTRDVFFAWDPALGREAPRGPSRYERSEAIIFRTSLYAGGVGAAVGLVRTISIATIPATRGCAAYSTGAVGWETVPR